MGMPVPGQRAPAFALPDAGGRVHRLDDYRGRWLVLYFYPRDGTPGCTREACQFRDASDRFQTLGAAIAGISTDSSGRHGAFAARHRLTFPLLADPDGTVAAAYGALRRLGPWRWARRCTFIIDPAGRVAQTFTRVRVRAHSEAVARALEALQHRAEPSA